MAPKMDITSFSSTTPVVKDDSIGNSASTITNDNHNDAATVAKTTSNDNNSDNTEDDDAIFLRWSRITKSVTIKTDGSGLLRGSIAAPTEDLTFRKAVRKQLSQFSLPSMTIGNIDRQNKNTKTILDEVSGYAAPGEILAMMGPSGSGKTSLLDCLSGRNPYNSGVVSVNGKLLGGSDMKRLMTKIAYVKQADIFFEHLTVRDQLGYTAMMRLPEKWTKQKKLGEVEEIIRLLRLTKVAESKIQTLSGGEKKRVNIGTELLTDPNVLLLDEPTSGLDSTSAVALIRMLQKLARNSNKTIITSIHQPSSALFQSFDRLIMLAEGHVVYFGKPKNSLHYLRQHKLDCPDGYNLADHWMDLLVQDSAIEGDNDNDNDNGVGVAELNGASEMKASSKDVPRKNIALQSDRGVGEEAGKRDTTTLIATTTKESVSDICGTGKFKSVSDNRDTGKSKSVSDICDSAKPANNSVTTQRPPLLLSNNSQKDTKTSPNNDHPLQPSTQQQHQPRNITRETIDHKGKNSISELWKRYDLTASEVIASHDIEELRVVEKQAWKRRKFVPYNGINTTQS
mmetsp:Transcript_2074/g.3885  ORF Transcript_2074/g.3885 Transcript_2074/m.3885 type:complete len:567 (-) Transcript_2074:132-1832(-)